MRRSRTRLLSHAPGPDTLEQAANIPLTRAEHESRATLRISATARSLLISYSSCLKALSMSQNTLSFLSSEPYRSMLPRLSPSSGQDFRPSPMQAPANASYARGQCGKADELLWRASADTNRMTTSPGGSFSSTHAFRTSDTGQAFAPADFSPSHPKYRSIKYRSPTPNLTAILLKLVALSAQAVHASCACRAPWRRHEMTRASDPDLFRSYATRWA